jgi:hypothetical protein
MREGVAGLSQGNEAVERRQIDGAVDDRSAHRHDAGPFLMTTTVFSL